MFLLDITIQPDPMVCPQGENGVHILSFDVLKNLRRASVLVLTRRRTLNPKTLNPKALKTLSLKAENTAYTQYFLQFLFSCSTKGNPQCCSPGKPRGLRGNYSYIMGFINQLTSLGGTILQLMEVISYHYAFVGKWWYSHQVVTFIPNRVEGVVENPWVLCYGK